MIKIENTDVYGFEAAIRGMRNPWNSWEKSDSVLNAGFGCNGVIVGENDLFLMKKLVSAGTDHSKFMRMINVTCDITAPMFWWSEHDTYKVATVRNSCSKMHTIHIKPFDIDDFTHDGCDKIPAAIDALKYVVGECEHLRKLYNDTKMEKYWRAIIELLPESFNMRATIQMNYAVLRNMYHARKNHKLDEWREFCRLIESLPYSELITAGNEDIRMISVPCMPGDHLYYIIPGDPQSEYDKPYVFEDTCTDVSTKAVFGIDTRYEKSELGVDLFLTKEEAQSALERKYPNPNNT